MRRFDYLHDSGNHWEHEVAIEEVRECAPDIDYPALVDGARRCPPRDLIGTSGFIHVLEAVLDPAHEEYRETLAWCGKPQNLADIEKHLMRRCLQTIAKRRRGGWPPTEAGLANASQDVAAQR